MPVTIPRDLPAAEVLKQENIFFMTKEQAIHQDIRPLQVVLLNLMPNKIRTEQQFLRLLGNTALQVELTFLTTATYQSKHTPRSYLQTFYQTFDQIRDRCFDALIITGSPVETLAFEEVAYWQELTEILSWADERVYSSFFVCWAAQAALYHHYGIGKILLPKKLSGVYSHTVRQKNHPLVRGFDDRFWAPHSRNTAVDESRLSLEHDLVVLSDSEEAGLYLVVSQDGRKVFVTGHSEYDELTLHDEYQRDLAAGLSLEQPSHYYQGEEVQVRWRGHAHLLFSNWLNYHVYQSTPYQLEQLSKVLQHS
ncbi:MAG: homoserine O-succinyltransferase [Sphaerochaeta sp.]|jgi:homoserine O-succinyltransferase|uniref:homoserine O-succinyltransferase n=1 Tax=unclassified Sphaerochaeta TaxID=2637943 RepID=UPI000E919F66|nr:MULTISPECIES: homoserine O-succinyltransferase [unclassified Sphaerochaeta]HBO35815.1 homoserine O-succinyltransferase [Sphaerochaeta sp.]